MDDIAKYTVRAANEYGSVRCTVTVQVVEESRQVKNADETERQAEESDVSLVSKTSNIAVKDMQNINFVDSSSLQGEDDAKIKSAESSKMQNNESANAKEGDESVSLCMIKGTDIGHANMTAVQEVPKKAEISSNESKVTDVPKGADIENTNEYVERANVEQLTAYEDVFSAAVGEVEGTTEPEPSSAKINESFTIPQYEKSSAQQTQLVSPAEISEECDVNKTAITTEEKMETVTEVKPLEEATKSRKVSDDKITGKETNVTEKKRVVKQLVEEESESSESVSSDEEVNNSPPTFVIKPKPMIVAAGETIKLECKVEG